MTQQPTARGSGTGTRARGSEGNEYSFWRDHTTITLSPVAAPSILGLFGFAASTFIVAAEIANWYGNSTITPLVLAPFVLVFGGVAQFLAGMWAYRARDPLATAMHGMWGSFWIAYGLYHILVAAAVLPGTTVSGTAATAFGFWFVALAAITWIGAFAAMAENMALSAVLLTLAAGATLLAISFIGGFAGLATIAGWVLIASALLAFYTASAMLLEATYKRVILPMGKRGSEHNVPGQRQKEMIQYQVGEPGIKAGQ